MAVKTNSTHYQQTKPSSAAEQEAIDLVRRIEAAGLTVYSTADHTLQVGWHCWDPDKNPSPGLPGPLGVGGIWETDFQPEVIRLRPALEAVLIRTGRHIPAMLRAQSEGGEA